MTDKKSRTSTSAIPHRVHRLLKCPDFNDPDKRSIFCIGIANLKSLGHETVKENSLINFSTTLIHQVLKAIPSTLTINCVYKEQKNISAFDVFMFPESHEDPLIEREVFTEGAEKIVSEIKAILANKKF